MAIADGGFEPLCGFGNRVGGGDADRVKPLGARKLLDQAAQPGGRQKSRLA
jgi:hypothetical protein